MDNFERLFGETREIKRSSHSLESLSKQFEDLMTTDWYKLMKQGARFSELGDYQNALNCLNSAIQQKPKHHHLLQVRAKIKENLGNFAGAIQDYKESLIVSGSDWYSIYNQIAINFLYQQNFEKAIMSFDIAIELKKGLISAGIIEESILDSSTVDGAVKYVPFEKMYINRANAKMSLENYQGSFDDCRSAIEANPEYSNSYYVLGLLYININQEEKALEAFNKAHNLGHSKAKLAIQQFLSN